MRRMPLNAGELDKFIILSGKFNFTDETLEHVLENELYGKIAVAILECSKKGTKKGVIIEDIEYGGFYVGEIIDDGTATLIQTNLSSASIVDLRLDTNDENNIKLIVSTDYASYLTAADTPKMYRHYLKFTFKVENTNTIVNGILYSSNNTDISGNNISKLNDLIKSPTPYSVLLILSNPLDDITGVLSHDGSNFVIYHARNTYAISTIADTVEPI